LEGGGGGGLTVIKESGKTVYRKKMYDGQAGKYVRKKKGTIERDY